MLSLLKAKTRQQVKAHFLRRMPRGVNLALDILEMYPDYRPSIIFDVGANTGDTARGFAADWPLSRIECFEPVGETYESLKQNTGRFSSVRCHKLALGATAGQALIQIGASSVLSSLMTEARRASDRVEMVNVQTVAEFCKTASIDRLGLLKIDTEGYDLEVLKGALHMLEAQHIDWVQVEAGMSPTNPLHVPLSKFTDFMSEKGYWLFGLYEQFHEWPSRKPYLRRANAVFVSQRLVDNYQYSPARTGLGRP